MPFTTALSGLNAASNNLAVTGNNIANANTVGFKKSRSEFADVYASSLGGVSSIQPGAGVRVANVAQQFNQGNLSFTENNLDLAISGEGFFTLAKSPTEVNDLTYSRAGEFKLDKEGYMVNNQGSALLVYRPNGTKVSDGFSVGVTQPVQINTLTGLPQATDEADLVLNLDANASVPTSQQALYDAVTAAQTAATNANTALTAANATAAADEATALAAEAAALADPSNVALATAATTARAAATASAAAAATALTTKNTADATLATATTAASGSTFDPTVPTSYNSQTSVTVYDSLGSAHIMTTYFVKGVSRDSTQSPPNSTDWYVFHYMSEPNTNTKTKVNVVGGQANGSGVLTFDSGGKLLTTAPTTTLGNFNLTPYTITPPTGAAPIDMNSVDYAGSTQVQQKFSVNSMSQNGLPAGRLTGIDIDDEGVIFARFSNGGSQTVGKVALTRFPNTNGLAKLGDTAWGQSANSGEPIRGEAGANNFGSIQSGAVEASNVDLAAQLVNLIVAQQHYQANAQTITTENQIMQAILNI